PPNSRWCHGFDCGVVITNKYIDSQMQQFHVICHVRLFLFFVCTTTVLFQSIVSWFVVSATHRKAT
ncbi:MAG: hypothetical protein MK100_09985, partial [Phycisphaerales bacterium]|nr:hypothetical protein [Phycisphaerales bacterium]